MGISACGVHEHTRTHACIQSTQRNKAACFRRAFMHLPCLVPFVSRKKAHSHNHSSPPSITLLAAPPSRLHTRPKNFPFHICLAQDPTSQDSRGVVIHACVSQSPVHMQISAVTW